MEVSHSNKGVASSLDSNPLYLLHNGFFTQNWNAFRSQRVGESIITQLSGDKPATSTNMWLHYIVLLVTLPECNCLLEKPARIICARFF